MTSKQRHELDLDLAAEPGRPRSKGVKELMALMGQQGRPMRRSG